MFDLRDTRSTFSIAASCQRTESMGVGVASGSIAAGSRCAYLRPNVGAVSIQAYTDPRIGPFVLDLLEEGRTPQEALGSLRERDRWASFRQVGIVDRYGNSTSFTGEEVLGCKHSLSGDSYSVQGNALTSPQVVRAMVESFRLLTRESLEERLLAALEAGVTAGGQRNGEQSASLIVFGTQSFSRTDLRVDWCPRDIPGQNAVLELRRLFLEWRDLIDYYQIRPDNPEIGTSKEWVARVRAERSSKGSPDTKSL